MPAHGFALTLPRERVMQRACEAGYDGLAPHVMVCDAAVMKVTAQRNDPVMQ